VVTGLTLNRKKIRLPAARYRGRGLYFVTLCFAGRRRFAANPHIASWIVARLKGHAKACAFFIIMRIVFCRSRTHTRGWRDGRKQLDQIRGIVQTRHAVAFSRRTHRRFWQFKYYDHILRASDSADGVAWWLNPVRKGLCRAPLEYRFLGSFTEIGAKLLRNGNGRRRGRRVDVTPARLKSTTVNQNQTERCRAKDRGATFKS
jgi:hypothetical protein